MKRERFGKRVSTRSVLRIVCIIGLALSAITSALLMTASLAEAREKLEQKHVRTIPLNPFVENLNRFDTIFVQDNVSPSVEYLDFILNIAEEHALGVQNHLSLLKRRRLLAKEIPEYRIQYRNAAARSLEIFPYSEPISIIAGDALLLQKNELNENDKIDLSTYIKNISMRNPLVLLGFYLFEGSARNFSTAKEIPQAAEIVISAIDHVGKSEQSGLITSAAVLRIFAGNQNGAIGLVNKYRTALLEQPRSAWFLAETLYDFDTPAAAASVLGSENYPYVNSQSIIRLGDALYRMNKTDDARFFWNLLTFPEEAHEVPPQPVLEKALYNLAGTSHSDDEKLSRLKELLHITPDHVLGTIMYSRLLNRQNAVSLLRQTLTEQDDPLIELELIRRNRGYSEPGKTAADTWMLLGRYPLEAELYQWASYFFQEMRMFEEAGQLEKNAGYNTIDAPWLTLQRALDCTRSETCRILY